MTCNHHHIQILQSNSNISIDFHALNLVRIELHASTDLNGIHQKKLFVYIFYYLLQTSESHT